MYDYDVKVRGTPDPPIFLWGSRGIALNLSWPLLLAVRNDVAGDPIEVHTETADGKSNLVGTLLAGEYYTIPLVGLRGVFATCKADSNVSCSILVPQIGPSV
ncbi:hypothetical protein B0G69_7982 [Paraburkholderia sp. RAU2J]|uniref:hypothetical protein n=1 Tax=Paraburkholderia sp. RAU2J TaxID=1938810 RepID=UPI000F1DF63F|nr:hypothetical protein [Paraburkholderia sp. RAU2J]RKT10554.1 hypothetical protein B0G69_7982 [Paraburkholderia sp. RAU2J]